MKFLNVPAFDGPRTLHYSNKVVILGVSEDPKFDVLTSGAGAIQVEA